MIKVILTAGNNSIEIIPKDNISIPFGSLNDNIQHEESRCQFSIPYESRAHSMLVQNGKILAVVMDDEETLFTGLVDDDISWIDNGNPEPIEEIPIVIRDNTYLLDKKPGNDIAFINRTLTYIVEQICLECGLTISLDSVFPDSEVRAFVLNKSESYLEGLSNVLYEYGFSFIFDGSGKLLIIDISGECDNFKHLSESEILAGLSWTKNQNQYDKITVSYASLTKKENEQVYWEGNGLDDDSMVKPIVLRPGQYYPYESDPVEESRSGQVYQTFQSGYAESYRTYAGEKRFRRSQKTSLLYTESHSVVQDWENGIVLERTEFGYCGASVRLWNSSNSDKNLFQLAIRADAWYRQDGCKIELGSGQKSFDYETRYIFDYANAQNFAGILSRFNTRGQFKIKARLLSKCKAGEYVSINTGISGVNANALVLSSSFSPDTNTYDIALMTFGEVRAVTGTYKELSAFDKEAETVVLEEVSYGISQSPQSQPAQWSTEIPAALPEQYLWTRRRTEYSSGREIISLTYSYQGKDGEAGAKGDKGDQGTRAIRYLGKSASGAISGDWYLNTSDGYVKTYNGSSWSNITCTSGTPDYRLLAAVEDMVELYSSTTSSTVKNNTTLKYVVGKYVKDIFAGTVVASDVTATRVKFNDYVASIANNAEVGSDVIYMGKNPLTDIDNAFHFAISQVKAKTNGKYGFYERFKVEDTFDGLSTLTTTNIFAKDAFFYGDVYKQGYGGSALISDYSSIAFNSSDIPSDIRNAINANPYCLPLCLSSDRGGDVLCCTTTKNGTNTIKYKVADTNFTDGTKFEWSFWETEHELSLTNSNAISATLTGHVLAWAGIGKFPTVYYVLLDGFVLVKIASSSTTMTYIGTGYRSMALNESETCLYIAGTSNSGYITSDNPDTFNIVSKSARSVTWWDDTKVCTSTGDYIMATNSLTATSFMVFNPKDVTSAQTISVSGKSVYKNGSLVGTVSGCGAVTNYNGILWAFIKTSAGTNELCYSEDSGETFRVRVNASGNSILTVTRYAGLSKKKGFMIAEAGNEVAHFVNGGNKLYKSSGSTSYTKQKYPSGASFFRIDNTNEGKYLNKYGFAFSLPISSSYYKTIRFHCYRLDRIPNITWDWSISPLQVQSHYFSTTKSYIKFTNGLIIQWGVAPGYNGPQTITFPLAFTSESSYAVTATLYGASQNCACITSHSRTSFNCDFSYGVSSGAKGGPWIAFGY